MSPMAALFDTLAASEALEAAGMNRRLARACAAQMQAAASTGEAVTRPELEAALAALKGELVDRIAESERRLASDVRALLWRLFGGIVGLAGLVVAALKLLP